MPDYLLLMHNDPARAADDSDWATYIERLARTGAFRGGSAIGNGARAAAQDAEAEKAELFEQIGRLKMELEWLKKKVAPLG